MKKYKNKYRIESTRLRSWDYGRNGSYFVTIIAKNRFHFFGEIISKKMNLNWMGLIAQECWIEIPKHFEFVKLDEFVVMPDHIHGIIIIDKSNNEHPRFRNQGNGTLSSIVGSFKSAVTKLINEKNIPLNINFGWQGRFHDHIIRNEKEFIRIANYIRNNPKNWKDDIFEY